MGPPAIGVPAGEGGGGGGGDSSSANGHISGDVYFLVISPAT